ncbi:sensor domain-containing diguanylate cyclase [Aliiglaciecola sp. CAU 1673]|uniref:sensor domain-containing diguanylate cyclase n=1 Tax=Aliiglaciecola sp. CAU 1673 TaxID=3032595 RepID=UPI0023DB08E5|nr:sensor domain-containing diguanylate cyclase [Aliiglaciecola sp. CAU 1673]MDF2177342.1 sensor domain-containing diguanylate cyclase [Aliiglaciecola sp. CAU 1673]
MYSKTDTSNAAQAKTLAASTPSGKNSTVSIPLCKNMLEALPDATMVVDHQGQIVMFNSQISDLFGYTKEELIGQGVSMLVPVSARNEHGKYVAEYLKDPVRRNMGNLMSLSGRHKDGRLIPVDIMLSPFEFEDKPWVICSIRDMTTFRQTQEALTQALSREKLLARIDSLTGVGNRRAFHEAAKHEIERSERYQRPFTAVYMDVDNFKQVNDEFGHDCGDRLLQRVTSITQLCLRQTDFLARLGGDEFGILLPETNLEEARKVIDRIRQELLREMRQYDWQVTFSIGVLVCTSCPETVDEMLKRVDELMYGVKRSGKDAVHYAEFESE